MSSTYTNNSGLTATDRQGEFITQVSPNVRLASRSGAVQGAIDYTLTGVLYSRHSESNETRNALNAVIAAELVPNLAFVNARASITQQVISAFGTQPADTGLTHSNSTEVANFGITPALRGSLAGVVDYDARVAYDVSRASSTDTGDSENASASLRLSGGRGRLGWALNASRNIVDFSAGRRTEEDRVTGTLSTNINDELRMSARVGREASNIATADRQARDSWGYSLNWAPSPRTSLALDADRRYFGNSHNLTFQHRTARTIWRYTDSRDAVSSTTPHALSAYDLFFAQFASVEPDPIKRETLVRSFLLLNGIDPTAASNVGFLSSAISLQSSRDLSVALTDVRTTYTLTAFDFEARRLDGVVGAPDDLSQVDRVRQLGFSVGVSHRLTPIAAITVLATQQKTLGFGSTPGNQQRSVNVVWTGRPGPRSTASIGGRHVRSESVTNPYTESGVTATVTLQF